MEWWDRAESVCRQKGLSFRDIDRVAGLPRNSTAQAMRERLDVRVSRFVAIADALGVSMDWLYGRDAPETPAEPLEDNAELKQALLTVQAILRETVAHVLDDEASRRGLAATLRAQRARRLHRPAEADEESEQCL
jgi:transcriptional regulator with XRE-family HTH domain